ncbi:hypothetical protein D3C87_796150 [compost metagenome]
MTLNDHGWQITHGTIISATLKDGESVQGQTYHACYVEPTKDKYNRLSIDEQLNDMWEWCATTFGDMYDFNGEIVWTYVTTNGPRFIFREESHKVLFVLRFKGT